MRGNKSVDRGFIIRELGSSQDRHDLGRVMALSHPLEKLREGNNKHYRVRRGKPERGKKITSIISVVNTKPGKREG